MCLNRLAFAFHPVPGNQSGTYRTTRAVPGISRSRKHREKEVTIRSCVSITGMGRMGGGEENTVSAPRDWLVEEPWLTKRNHVYHESSRLQALRKLTCSSLDHVHDGIVVLLERISVGDHQNDGPCRPKRTNMSDLRTDEICSQALKSDRHDVVLQCVHPHAWLLTANC